MAYATPGPTIYDEANLRLVENWSRPIMEDLARREAMARELRGYDFAEGQQRRAYDARRQESETERKVAAEKLKVLQATTEQSLSDISQARERIVTELSKAQQELDAEIAANGDLYARRMMPNFKPTDPVQMAQFEQLRAEGRAQGIASQAAISKRDVLRRQFENIDRMAGAIADDAIRLGVPLKPMMRRELGLDSGGGEPQDELAIPPGNVPATAPSPSKEVAGPVLPGALEAPKQVIKDLVAPIGAAAVSAIPQAARGLFGGPANWDAAARMIQEAMTPNRTPLNPALAPSGGSMMAFPQRQIQPQLPVVSRELAPVASSEVAGPMIPPGMMQLPTGQWAPKLEESAWQIFKERMSQPVIRPSVEDYDPAIISPALDAVEQRRKQLEEEIKRSQQMIEQYADPETERRTRERNRSKNAK